MWWLVLWYTLAWSNLWLLGHWGLKFWPVTTQSTIWCRFVCGFSDSWMDSSSTVRTQFELLYWSGCLEPVLLKSPLLAWALSGQWPKSRIMLVVGNHRAFLTNKAWKRSTWYGEWTKSDISTQVMAGHGHCSVHVLAQLFAEVCPRPMALMPWILAGQCYQCLMGLKKMGFYTSLDWCLKKGERNSVATTGITSRRGTSLYIPNHSDVWSLCMFLYFIVVCPFCHTEPCCTTALLKESRGSSREGCCSGRGCKWWNSSCPRPYLGLSWLVWK